MKLLQYSCSFRKLSKICIKYLKQFYYWRVDFASVHSIFEQFNRSWQRGDSILNNGKYLSTPATPLGFTKNITHRHKAICSALTSILLGIINWRNVLETESVNILTVLRCLTQKVKKKLKTKQKNPFKFHELVNSEIYYW